MNKNDLQVIDVEYSEVDIEVTREFIKAQMVEQSRMLQASLVPYFESIRNQTDAMEEKIKNLHSELLKAYPDHGFVLSASECIDVQLKQARVLKDFRKEAKEFVKLDAFPEGKWQNERIADYEVKNGKQYRDINRHMTYSIDKCKRWHPEWFEVTLTRKELLEMQFGDLLKTEK